MKNVLNLVPFLFFISCASPKIATPVAKGQWKKDGDRRSSRFEKNKPLVIGHRGACGYLPEHTLESYSLAIDMGADYIEPDIVITKDGVLITRHEPELSETTDVALKFPKLRKKKVIDGVPVEGWFAEDLTLQQIKTLRAKERLPFRNHSRDGKFKIATFEEFLQFIKKKSKEKNRVIGIYPETKHPSYFQSIGLPLEDKIVKLLKRYGFNKKDAPVFIQSMETANLKYLRKVTPVKLVFLMDEEKLQPYDFVLSKDKRNFGDLMKPEALKEIATFANGIGPWKSTIVHIGPNKELLPATTLIEDAHAAGLLVHPYTFRSDGDYLNPDYEGDPSNEYLHFYKLGVDGLFSDFADHALKARDLLGD